MGVKVKREELTADQIRVGAIYRAKKFREGLGFSNDRVVQWISPNRDKVQYDSDTVGLGRHYPTVTMDQFIRWASHEVNADGEEVKPSDAASK